MGTTSYRIKLFDETLAVFEFEQDGPGAAYPCHIEIDEATRHLLPLNLMAQPTDDELARFLNTRRIPKNRAFAEAVLAPYGIAASDTKSIIDLTKGASINDSFLVTAFDDPTTFAECNLFDNDFNVALQIAAYTGVISEGALQAGLPSELTASGSFPKAWRIIGGKRVLYKAGGVSKAAELAIEPYSELLAFQVARAMGLNATAYGLTRWRGSVCSTCELFNTKDVSFVPLYSALPREGIARLGLNRAMEYYFAIGPRETDEFLSMLTFDSVIANKDRHFGNFGVMRENATGDVLRMAPLFDHNLSLFCGEPEAALSLDGLLAALKRYSGTFATNLEDQLGYSMGERQREQVSRLVDFEFELPGEFSEYGKRHSGERDAFTPQRLGVLAQYIQHVAKQAVDHLP